MRGNPQGLNTISIVAWPVSKMRGGNLLLGALVFVSLLATAIAPVQASTAERHFRTDLAGANEVPPRAVDGSGHFEATLNANDGINFNLKVCHIQDVTQAHIHVGAAGVNGPIILFLFGPAFADPVDVDTCTMLSVGKLDASDLIPRPAQGVNTFDDAIQKIRDGQAYVNVHTTTFPGGEIRGQLEIV